LCLSPKITLAIVRLEESSDGAISVERQKRPALSVESRGSSVIPDNLFYVPAHGPVAQRLGCKQILILAQPAEFPSVLRKMLVEIVARAKADSSPNRIILSRRASLSRALCCGRNYGRRALLRDRAYIGTTSAEQKQSPREQPQAREADGSLRQSNAGSHPKQHDANLPPVTDRSEKTRKKHRSRIDRFIGRLPIATVLFLSPLEQANPMLIENISDTARWVAYYRAMETGRPDAIFRDPFAARLAGERGEHIVDNMKSGRGMAWAMIVRTAVFDEIILDTISSYGVDTVINLAAGLDSRAWRLPLSPSLRWIDVDLPGILDYKLDTLRESRPVCDYEAVRLDLTDVAARKALFVRLGAASKTTLVITEGLLVYLTADQVGKLATDLHASESFRFWLIDIASPRLLAIMRRSWGKSVNEGNAQFQFAPAEGTDFYTKFGWRESEFRSSMEEAHRLQREMNMAWLWRFIGRLSSAAKREEFRRMSGIVLLEKA